jgi:uroporphyrinogen-III synthase
MNILLTHAPGTLHGLQERLERQGHEVQHKPLIRIEPRLDDGTRRHAEALLQNPWMLFTSRAAVKAWKALELPLRGPRLGAVGRATRRSLEEAGGQVDVVGFPERAEGLAVAFMRHPHASGPVGLPQGSQARTTLADSLNDSGHAVHPVTLYDTHVKDWPDGLTPDVIAVASPSAASAIPDGMLRHCQIVAIGSMTGGAIMERGVMPIVATSPNAQGLYDAIQSASQAQGFVFGEGLEA